ncbi:MAG: FecR family protein [Xanthobacteraceae bacterium]
MAVSRWLGTVSSFVLTAFFASHGASAQNGSKIGVASAAKNRVDGTVGGTTRPLSAGSNIFAREVVRTGEQSSAQLLFLDETSLSIGPQSEVTLDRFVFDPNRGAGNVVVNVSRGALRFVSGSQQSSSYQIKTPVATIGVRGTLFQVYVTFAASGQPVVYLLWVEGTGPVNYAGKTINMGPGQGLVLTNSGIQGPFAWPWSAHLTDMRGQLLDLAQIPDSAADLRDQLFGTGGPPPDVGYGN